MKKSMVFENDNGKRYFVMAGGDREALLRTWTEAAM